MGMQLQLTIEKLVYGGDGLARIDSPDGRKQVVFVPLVLPGEVVRAELQPASRGRLTAQVVEILKPAAERIVPRCEYFGRCGGCQLQHAGAEYQLELKRGMLIETLRRTGGIDWTGDVHLHAGPAWGYRNRIRLQRSGQGIGYYSRGSHRVLPVNHCPIASPAIESGLRKLAAESAGAAPDGSREEVEMAVNNRDQGLHCDAALDFEVAGCRFRVSAGSFFQVNRFLTEALVEVVTGGAAGEAALDLFCGVGLFALPLARRFDLVEAVESHPAAYADLERNAAAFPGVRISNRPALAYLRHRAAAPLDFAVADPPRTGLGTELVAALLDAAPLRLHLVSCDPATLGRDLKGLLAGGYGIEEIHLFDLFPQTYHLETVVKLCRLGRQRG